MEPIYLDHNATSPPLPEVAEAMLPFLGARAGNPSSPHARGETARRALGEARAAVARLIGAGPEEIVFTSSGTEADNLALRGCLRRGDHVVASAIEHPAVLETLRALQDGLIEVTLVRPDADGRVAPRDVQAALRPRTRLVTVMMANNETGVLQPVEELGALAAAAGALFHTDAVQAAGKVPIDVRRPGCSLLSLSGHKLGGPQGTGALYVRAGTALRPLLRGGGQERGRRAGTENVPGLVGLGVAALRAAEWVEGGRAAAAQAALRDAFEAGLRARIPRLRVNGGGAPRVPNTCNVSVEAVSGRALVAALDAAGVCASTGSACAAVANEPPHVLLAMGLPPALAHAAVRFSLGKQTTAQELEAALELFAGAVQRLRAVSPSWTAEAREAASLGR